ncbi:hypothetical protein [Paenibacillus silviterrae]|uniref:hypothetical protein n=1 Tax=Paenibacillus silviterrae TaxID=3242194 RepID=UPI002543A449|nr:hypothetical protein [Paenibacillus chinjuensis]
MKWLNVLGLLATVGMMTLYEWPRIRGKREKWTYGILTLLGLQLSILLMFFPEMPGPTELIDALYSPLGKLLEK